MTEKKIYLDRDELLDWLKDQQIAAQKEISEHPFSRKARSRLTGQAEAFGYIIDRMIRYSDFEVMVSKVCDDVAHDAGYNNYDQMNHDLVAYGDIEKLVQRHTEVESPYEYVKHQLDPDPVIKYHVVTDKGCLQVIARDNIFYVVKEKATLFDEKEMAEAWALS